MNRRVYFAAADRQLEPYFVDERQFERSLVHSLLFQPGEIVIPDIFFFGSEAIMAHVGRGGLSLLEACLRARVIRPAFREPVGSFRESLARLKQIRQHGILEDRADYLAARLDHAVHDGVHAINWDVNAGGEWLDSLVTRFLQTDIPLPDAPAASADLSPWWNITRRWRTDVIEEARRRTNAGDRRGLSRAEVLRALARNLGFSSQREVQDVTELVPVARNSNEADALSHYWRWITQLYHISQAAQLGSDPTFPQMSPGHALAVGIAVSPGSDDVPDGNAEVFEAEVVTPSYADLLTLDPDVLVKIRSNDGAAYFAAAQVWMAQPSVRGEEELRRCLLLYAAALTKRVHEGMTGAWRLWVRLFGTRERHRLQLSSLLTGPSAVRGTDLTGLICSRREGFETTLYLPPGVSPASSRRAHDLSIDVGLLTVSQKVPPHIERMPDVTSPDSRATARYKLLIRLRDDLREFQKTLRVEDLPPFIGADAELMMRHISELRIANEPKGDAFELSVAERALSFGAGLLDALVGLGDDLAITIARLILIHEVYHHQQNLESTTYFGVGRAGFALEEVDYWADAIAVGALAHWRIRRGGEEARSHFVEIARETIDAVLFGIEAFDRFEQGPRIDRLPERRLRRYLIWHLQRVRAMTLSTTDDIWRLLRERLIVEMAPLVAELDPRGDRMVRETALETELFVVLNRRLARSPQSPSFRPQALLTAVRSYDHGAIEANLRSVRDFQRNLLTPWLQEGQGPMPDGRNPTGDGPARP